MLIPLKKKFLSPGNFKKTVYRTRTGPRCCGPNCPSTRKKLVKTTKNHG